MSAATLDAPPTWQLLKQDGNAALASGRPAEAAEKYESALQSLGAAESAAAVVLHANAAQACLHEAAAGGDGAAGQKAAAAAARALRHCDKGLALDAGHEKCRYRKAKALSLLGRREESMALLSSIVAARPDNIEAAALLRAVRGPIDIKTAMQRALSEGLYADKPDVKSSASARGGAGGRGVTLSLLAWLKDVFCGCCSRGGGGDNERAADKTD